MHSFTYRDTPPHTCPPTPAPTHPHTHKHTYQLRLCMCGLQLRVSRLGAISNWPSSADQAVAMHHILAKDKLLEAKDLSQKEMSGDQKNLIGPARRTWESWTKHSRQNKK